MTINKIDSNVTGLAIAEELTLKVLPGTLGADAIWYGMEPNSYPDFGGEITNVARAPINASRQRQKCTVTDLDASGGFNTDFTQNNMQRILQGFFFADAREKPDTIPLNGTALPFVTVDANSYNRASGLDIFKVNHLCLAESFTNSGNNGLFKVTAVGDAAVAATNTTAQTGVTFTATTAGTGPNGVTSMRMIDSGIGNGVADGSAIVVSTEAVTVDIRKVGDAIRTRTEVVALFGSANTPLAGIIIAAVTASGGTAAAAGSASFFTGGLAAIATGTLTTDKVLTVEASPPAAARVRAVGFQFPTTDLSFVASSSVLKMVSAATNLTTLGLNAGEWIFIGGDDSGTQFAGNDSGYARIKSIAATTVEFSETTFAATTDAGTGKTVRIFFGTVIRNEDDPDLIVRRSYQIERQLGDDGVGTQAEYLLGSIPNELTFNIPQADKLNCDLSFVSMDNEFKTGTEGVKAGTRVAIPGEAAFNTSSDIYRLRMNIVDPASLNNSALFGYVTEMTMSINNNVTPSKAVSVLGAFDATAGNFEFSGSVTAYFSTVAAVAAVRANADVALNIIAAHDNAGFAIDAPLVGLGGGRLNVEKDAAVMMPLEAAGAQNSLGYTALATFFPYLPNVGMPS